MSLIIDVIVIAAFGICFLSGIKKGFIKSVMGIAVIILAIIGSAHFSPPLAQKFNDDHIEKAVVGIADDAVRDLISEDRDVDQLINDKSEDFLSLLERFGVKEEQISSLFGTESEEQTDDEKVSMIAKKLGEPVALSVSKALAFLIVFALLALGLFIVAVILCAIVKLPFLNAANKLLGGLLGAAMGLILAWGLSVAISELMPHLAVLYKGSVPDTVIENSIVVKFLGSIDPMNLIK